MKKECLSPERDSPWIMHGTCTEQQYVSSFSSSEIRSCGLCGEQTKDFRSLRDDIAKMYEEKCKDLVVYGAALGKEYEDWLQNPKKLMIKLRKLL